MNVSFVYIRGLYPGSPPADVGPTPTKNMRGHCRRHKRGWENALKNEGMWCGCVGGGVLERLLGQMLGVS